MTSRRLVLALTFVGVVLPGVIALVAIDAAPVLTLGSAGAVFSILGGTILVRRPGHRIGWLYLAIGLEFGLFFAANTARFGATGTDTWWQWLLDWSTGWGWAVGPLLAVTFGLLWLPDGHEPSPRWRYVRWWTWTALVGVVVVFPLTESSGPVRRTLGVDPGVAEAAFLVVALALAVAILACVVSPFVRYRHADARTRQQLLLVGLGGLGGLTIYLTGDLTTRAIPSLTWEHVFLLAILVLPVTSAVAIFRYGMLDIGRILSRTLAYAIVSAVLAGVYALGVIVVGQVVPGEGNDLLVAGSTLAVAALFQPVRRVVQRSIERRFNRARYDADQAVASFRVRLRDELDLVAVADELCDVVGETLMPTSVGLLLTGMSKEQLTLPAQPRQP